MPVTNLSRYICALCFLVVLAEASAAEKRQDPINDADLRTVDDLLRGYNDQKLAAARKNIPKHPEPPLATAQPREVIVKGLVYYALAQLFLPVHPQEHLPMRPSLVVDLEQEQQATPL